MMLRLHIWQTFGALDGGGKMDSIYEWYGMIYTAIRLKSLNNSNLLLMMAYYTQSGMVHIFSRKHTSICCWEGSRSTRTALIA